MYIDLPCEYCSKITQWDTRLAVPACCQDCKRIPLVIGSTILFFSIILMCVAAYFLYGVSR